MAWKMSNRILSKYLYEMDCFRCLIWKVKLSPNPFPIQTVNLEVTDKFKKKVKLRILQICTEWKYFNATT